MHGLVPVLSSTCLWTSALSSSIVCFPGCDRPGILDMRVVINILPIKFEMTSVYLFLMPQPNKTKLPLQVLAVVKGNKGSGSCDRVLQAIVLIYHIMLFSFPLNDWVGVWLWLSASVLNVSHSVTSCDLTKKSHTIGPCSNVSKLLITAKFSLSSYSKAPHIGQCDLCLSSKLKMMQMST